MFEIKSRSANIGGQKKNSVECLPEQVGPRGTELAKSEPCRMQICHEDEYEYEYEDDEDDEDEDDEDHED